MNLKETITENTSCGDKLHWQTSFINNNLKTETRASLLTPWRYGFYTKYFTADFFINTNVNVVWNLLEVYLWLFSLNVYVVKIDCSKSACKSVSSLWSDHKYNCKFEPLFNNPCHNIRPWPGHMHRDTSDCLQSVTRCCNRWPLHTVIISTSIPLTNTLSTHLELRVDLSDHAEVQGVQDSGSVYGDHAGAAHLLQEDLHLGPAWHLIPNRDNCMSLNDKQQYNVNQNNDRQLGQGEAQST